MATLRTRLTVAYGFALIGGLIVFAVALWTVRVAQRDRRSSGPPRSSRPIACSSHFARGC